MEKFCAAWRKAAEEFAAEGLQAEGTLLPLNSCFAAAAAAVRDKTRTTCIGGERGPQGPFFTSPHPSGSRRFDDQQQQQQQQQPSQRLRSRDSTTAKRIGGSFAASKRLSVMGSSKTTDTKRAGKDGRTPQAERQKEA